MSPTSQNTKVSNIKKHRDKLFRKARKLKIKPRRGTLNLLPSHITREDGWRTGEPPQTRTSRMFVAMLGIYVLTVGGIVAFHFWGKDDAKDAAKSASSSPAAARTAAPATPAKTEPAPVVVVNSPQVPPGYAEHIIKVDESWDSIARQHDTTTAELKGANPGAEFHIGRRLLIPPRRNLITPEPDEKSLQIVAQKNAVKLPDINGSPQVRYAVNPEGRVLPAPSAREARADERPPAARAAKKTAPPPMGKAVKASETGAPKVSRQHKVGPGETLTSISKKYGVTVGQLMRTNSLTESSKLRQGQTLKVPAGRQ